MSEETSEEKIKFHKLRDYIMRNRDMNRDKTKFIIIQNDNQKDYWVLYQWFNYEMPASYLYDFVITNKAMINNFCDTFELTTIIDKKETKIDPKDEKTTLRCISSFHTVEITYKNPASS